MDVLCASLDALSNGTQSSRKKALEKLLVCLQSSDVRAHVSFNTEEVLSSDEEDDETITWSFVWKDCFDATLELSNKALFSKSKSSKQTIVSLWSIFQDIVKFILAENNPNVGTEVEECIPRLLQHMEEVRLSPGHSGFPSEITYVSLLAVAV